MKSPLRGAPSWLASILSACVVPVAVQLVSSTHLSDRCRGQRPDGTGASMTSASAAAKRAVLIGNFDGVHKGHQALIRRARSLVGADGSVVIVTFTPHPTTVVAPHRIPALLTTPDERAAALHDAGADDVVVVPFTAEVSRWSPKFFVLSGIAPLHPDVVVVGENFRFGSGGGGTVETLEELGFAWGFDTVTVALAGDAHQTWSSSRIRTLIADGDVVSAAQALGRLYALSGVVVHGDARGRELGFPTANVDVDRSKAVPADGVYAGWLDVGEQRFAAAISIGTNPQFAGDSRRVEAFALDAPEGFDIYDAMVRVQFVSRVRGQQVYSDIPALIAAISADVSEVRQQLLIP